MRIRQVAAACAITLSVGVAACGDSKSDSATSTPVADFNDADVEFAQGMIPHHEQAIEMSEIALDPTVGASDAVRNLATRISAAQDPEIDLMTDWLTAWEQPIQMDMGDGHDMSSMEGMMSAEDMSALADATGTEFDALWLEMMIRHHEGAITMASTALSSGSNKDVLALADRVIAAQQAEINEMKALLGS